MSTKLGLNGVFERCKGAGVRYKVRHIWWELQYAFQRAWRGYDYADISIMCDQFIDRMQVLLPEFKRHNVGLFSRDGDILSEEETDAVLDRMIYAITSMKEDVCKKDVGGVHDETGKLDLEKFKQANDLLNTHKNEFFDLFKEWFWCLWY